ncbi:MAG: hypothetical protein GY862_35950, partial [Gammaproteobacteria bacterium]|nr:hypothetical protein [Gammaproteobacteria bacterium]
MSSYPYPGLRPFAREETDIFFGREEHTITLLERLKENRFLAILGPSGYGKSSLVRTGLLAALEGGMLAEAGSHWRIADIRPGDAPFARLAEALTTNFQAPDREKRMLKKSLEKHLRRADFSLHEIYQDLAEKTEEDGGPAINLLILADQFEELFRLCLPHKRAEASAFVALLLAACRHPRIYVVITMRSEFLGECAQFYDLPEAINTGLFLTPRLTREQLREAIELPARVFGGNIEPRLTGRLLNDLGNRPDQLPVLAHALRYLWGVQKTPVLSLDNYLQTGSLDQVLSQRLDRIYEDLTPTQQKIAETMFRCLTERGDGKTDTRRPAPLEEIARVAACDWRDVAAAAQKFRAEGRNFLMPPPATALDDPAQILDISHESLIRQWHKLRGWIKAEAEKAEMYKRLLEAAQRRQQGEGGLWDGPDLAAALAWREKHQPAPEWAERYKSIISASKSVIPANKSAIPANKSAIPANKSVIPANKSVIPANKAVIPANAGIQKIGMSSRVPGNDGQGSRSTVQTGQFDLAMEFLAAGETAQRRARQRKIGFIAGFMLFLALTAAVMSVQWRQAVDAEQQAKQAAVRAEQAAVRAEQAEQRAEEEKQQRTAMLFDATLTHASLLARGEDYAEAKESLAKTYLLDAEILPQRRHARNLLAGYAEILGGAAEFVYEGAGAALSGVAIS